jgi:hypothetical protein
MRQKNLGTASQVQTDYDQDAASYDEIRFGTPGGRYVNELDTSNRLPKMPVIVCPFIETIRKTLVLADA